MFYIGKIESFKYISNKPKNIMSAFINPEDYDSTLHAEILDALTRSDDAILEQCENDAIAEMSGYLANKYDVEKIFARRGSERNNLILMYAKDIAIYHVFCVHNPYKMSKVRQERYDRAMEWLKQVASGNIAVVGADALPEEERSERSNFSIKSNTLKPTHY